MLIRPRRAIHARSGTRPRTTVAVGQCGAITGDPYRSAPRPHHRPSDTQPVKHRQGIKDAVAKPNPRSSFRHPTIGDKKSLAERAAARPGSEFHHLSRQLVTVEADARHHVDGDRHFESPMIHHGEEHAWAAAAVTLVTTTMGRTGCNTLCRAETWLIGFATCCQQTQSRCCLLVDSMSSSKWFPARRVSARCVGNVCWLVFGACG